jgi:hypothetical protein
MAADDRLHGSHGLVKMDPTGVGGVTAVAVAGLDKWELDMSKDHVRVTAFGDTNHVYVDGLPDLKGSYGGWFDPVDGLGVFEVIFGTVKPYLELYPNEADVDIKWSGKGLIDGKISVDANGGVAVSGTFVGAGPWTFPTAALTALGRRGEDRRG